MFDKVLLLLIGFAAGLYVGGQYVRNQSRRSKDRRNKHRVESKVENFGNRMAKALEKKCDEFGGFFVNPPKFDLHSPHYVVAVWMGYKPTGHQVFKISIRPDQIEITDVGVPYVWSYLSENSYELALERACKILEELRQLA